ncbi:MAG: DUF4926 domain-containing protein [Verrucomicrobiota bacterium]
MKAPLLHRMDEVALLKDLPEHGLRFGETGVVIQTTPNGLCDIEFVNEGGESIILKEFPKEELVLVRHRRDLMS